MKFFKTLNKTLKTIESITQPPKTATSKASNMLSWEQACAKWKGDCAFFHKPEEDTFWHVAVPMSLLDPDDVKENKRRKSAASLEIEEITDREELAERKAEILEDYEDMRDEFETEAEFKTAVKSEMDALAQEIKWSDMMIICPLRKASGEQLAIAVREKDHIGDIEHELYPDQKCRVFPVFSNIYD